MASRIDDRWLWLGVGVLSFFVVKGIQYALTDIVRLTEIDPHQYEPKRRTEDHPEDALTVQDLRVLADSPHPNIANATLALIIARLVRLPHATQMVNKDLTSGDEAVRKRAHTAVHFLRYYDGPLEYRRHLPISPPGYTTPTHWSDGMRTPSDDGYSRQITFRVLDDEGFDDGGIVVPSVEDPVAGWEDVPRERGSGAGDVDEAEMRRRRREAAVFHEGQGAITREDIIRPRVAD